MNFFISTLWSAPVFFAEWTLWVIFSITLHEYCHARVAFELGDSTAADAGHLTLNPLKQMGAWSLVCFLLVGIAWGAVPVTPQRLRGRHGDLLVSLAGPFTNLALAILALLLGLITIWSRGAWPVGGETEAVWYGVLQFFLLGAELNLVLFIFNMLPIPSFDGFALVREFGSRALAESELAKGIMVAMVLLLFYFFDYLYRFADFLIGVVVGALT